VSHFAPRSTVVRNIQPHLVVVRISLGSIPTFNRCTSLTVDRNLYDPHTCHGHPHANAVYFVHVCKASTVLRNHCENRSTVQYSARFDLITGENNSLPMCPALQAVVSIGQRRRVGSIVQDGPN